MNAPDVMAADLSWFRDHLTTDILPHWLRCPVTDAGLYLPCLDRRWQPVACPFATLVTQSRLLYVLSQGYRLTGSGEYLVAVTRGAACLLEQFRDDQYGGWFWSVDPKGLPVDRGKDGYGHAFVIFGLSHAYAVTREKSLLDAALATSALVRERFQDAHGGMRWKMSRDFQDRDRRRSQNPLMHLFEALCALSSEGGDRASLAHAVALADFLVTRIMRPDGRLPEDFDLDWSELPASAGGRCEIGHVFEWAYLLSNAVDLGLPPPLLEHARTLLDYGMRVGYDRAQGGVFSKANEYDTILGTDKRWWDQCEAARALMHFAFLRNAGEFTMPFVKSTDCIKQRFIDPVYGGWYQTVTQDGTVTADAKGNEWKVDYHATGLCMEAVRLQVKEFQAD